MLKVPRRLLGTGRLSKSRGHSAVALVIVIIAPSYQALPKHQRHPQSLLMPSQQGEGGPSCHYPGVSVRKARRGELRGWPVVPGSRWQNLNKHVAALLAQAWRDPSPLQGERSGGLCGGAWRGECSLRGHSCGSVG